MWKYIARVGNGMGVSVERPSEAHYVYSDANPHGYDPWSRGCVLAGEPYTLPLSGFDISGRPASAKYCAAIGRDWGRRFPWRLAISVRSAGA